MEKGTLGFIVLIVAGINFYLSARIYTLMKFEGSPEEVAVRRKKAQRLSFVSKASYFVVVISVGIFYFIKGK